MAVRQGFDAGSNPDARLECRQPQASHRLIATGGRTSVSIPIQSLILCSKPRRLFDEMVLAQVVCESRRCRHIQVTEPGAITTATKSSPQSAELLVETMNSLVFWFYTGRNLDESYQYPKCVCSIVNRARVLHHIYSLTDTLHLKADSFGNNH